MERKAAIVNKPVSIPENTAIEVLAPISQQESGAEWIRIRAELYVPSHAVTIYMWHWRTEDPENCSALRARPDDDDSPQVSKYLRPGVRVVAVDRRGDWSYVSVPGTPIEGWIRSKHLRRSPPEMAVHAKAAASALIPEQLRLTSPFAAVEVSRKAQTPRPAPGPSLCGGRAGWLDGRTKDPREPCRALPALPSPAVSDGGAR